MTVYFLVVLVVVFGVFVEARGVADVVDFVGVFVPPLLVRVVVVVVREAPPVVDVFEAAVDFAGVVREVVDFGAGTRLALVGVRLVVVLAVAEAPEVSGLLSSQWTDVWLPAFLTLDVGVEDLGEARPSLLPALLSAAVFSPLRLVPDFLRAPKEGESLRSAPDPSRDIPGRLVRKLPMECDESSGEAPSLWMSKLVRPSAKAEKINT